MKVMIAGPNLNDQSRGSFHVHADGCADIARQRRREPAYADRHRTVVFSKRHAVEIVYADQLREGADYESCRMDLHFFPCCDALPEQLSDEAPRAADPSEAPPPDPLDLDPAAMRDALLVITRDPKIRRALDPKALEQAERALTPPKRPRPTDAIVTATFRVTVPPPAVPATRGFDPVALAIDAVRDFTLDEETGEPLDWIRLEGNPIGRPA